MESPRPVPPKRRVVDWSAWEKAVKIAPSLSRDADAGVPHPDPQAATRAASTGSSRGRIP
jgi:hypothetical protein